ncbi:mitochondrial ribosome and complex I assembly factor AltMIEF1 [Planococcus citri]|uniref:mitochondrial ribosome and complex I assembly factor AltMIEF1 n=1 Tax=Planococcus citri TaxID=170843 RepID=UPI0031F7CE0C
MNFNPCSQRKIILLYRDLLKYGRNLQLTDKEYFMSRVKNEFKQNKNLEDPAEIEFQYKKGITLLKNSRII